MTLHVTDGSRGVATPTGRSLDEILADINENNENKKEIEELVDIIECLRERLVHTDSERF